MSVHTVQYEGIEIEYELTRKNVKYINLRVNKHGKVVVSAGEQVPFAVIDEFVQSKAFWIITHLAEIEKIRNEISDASLYDGKTVYYLGKPYRLRLERGEQRITVAEDTILLSSPKLYSDVLKAEYLAWLKAQAEKESAILRADAVREQKIREADGEATAILKVQQAYADSLKMLNDAAPTDKVLTLKSFEALAKVADGQATKLIIPSEMQSLAGFAASIKEIVTDHAGAGTQE